MIATLITGLAVAAPFASPDVAQTTPDLESLRSELMRLRQDQQATAARIDAIETALNRIEGKPVKTATAAVSPSPAVPPTPSLAANVTTIAGVPIPPKLALSGDLRVRYESNFGDTDARDRGRIVMRARLRGTYGVNEWLQIGGELDTGDPDDPKTTDVTLSGFDNDLLVSLSQAYARGTFGGLQLQAGKFPVPFTRTELVFDNDLNPTGGSASYSRTLSSTAKLRATALYFLIDEAPNGPDSRMIGGQVGGEFGLSHALKVDLAGSYYAYTLRSLAGATANDIRTNRFAGGKYLSDYKLLDLVASVTWSGLGARWPVRLVGDYVHNYGAIAGDDRVEADVTVGRATTKGDWRVTYGYSEAGVDAVLAAFSHDNTTIGTNYLQHTLALDYMLHKGVTLNATYYRYRPKDPHFAGANDPSDWLDRLRLNLLVGF